MPPRVSPLPLREIGSVGTVTNEVLWLGAPRINAAAVTYLVRNTSCEADSFDVDLGPAAVAPSKFGWETKLPLSQHADQIKEAYGNQVTILEITARALVTNPEWKPPFGFGFDAEITVEPGTVSNVENGFGFVGGAYVAETTWRLEEDTYNLIGLLTPNQIATLCSN